MARKHKPIVVNGALVEIPKSAQGFRIITRDAGERHAYWYASRVAFLQGYTVKTVRLDGSLDNLAEVEKMFASCASYRQEELVWLKDHKKRKGRDGRTDAGQQPSKDDSGPDLTSRVSPRDPGLTRAIHGMARGTNPITMNWNLPLYPDEHQIALAVMGPKRAREWRSKAEYLERKGLPRIDELMGGRFWPAVIEFFARREGNDRNDQGAPSAFGRWPTGRDYR
jgi:hypothetical protein